MDKKVIEDWLDKYFNDELSESELIEFKELINTNQEFKDSFKLEQKIILGIRESKKKELKEIISHEHNLYINNNTTKIRTMNKKKFPILAIAATLLVLIAAVFVFNQGDQNDPYNNKNYLASVETFQKKNMAKFSSRGGSDELTTLSDSLNLGLDLSLKGKYKESKQLFLKASELHPENEFIQLQLAFQDFYLSNYANVFPRLDKIVNSKDVDVREESEMLYAQAAFKLEDQMTTAKTWLNKIASQINHRYVKEAKGMLSLLG